MVLGKNYKIYHKPADPQRPFSLLVEATRGPGQNEALYFESGVITTLSSEDLAGLKPLHTKLLDAYALLGVLTYNAGNHRILYLVVVNSCISVGKLLFGDVETEVLRITSVVVISLRNGIGDEDRLAEFVKLLSSGIFYFAVSANASGGPSVDLTLCTQRVSLNAPTDNRFFWNRGLHLYLQSFGISCDKWLIKMICGGVEIKTLYVGQYQARACIVSRFNCYRAGTRFQVRGANDDGNVANFVETEQLICLGDQTSSFIQIRGSVPLFWEQTGVQVGAHKISFSRSFETMSPAFERHLNMIRREYGDQVVINLLGNKEGETKLSEVFQRLMVTSPYHSGMLYIHFDYHANCRGGRTEALSTDLKDKIDPKLTEFRFFHSTQERGVLLQQTGTVRTNCLDCLDRTNAVQTFIGLTILDEQLKAFGLHEKPQIVARFQQLFAQLWTQNGDHVSRIYAGTGALDGKSKSPRGQRHLKHEYLAIETASLAHSQAIKRPRTLETSESFLALKQHMLKDGARSVSRTLQNNLFDNSKQEAMDILLSGAMLNSEHADRARTILPFNLRQVPLFLLGPMFERMSEYTHTEPLTFWVGTWNVNGGKHLRTPGGTDRPIDDWLLDCATQAKQNKTNFLLSSYDPSKPVDVFAVGFEEIVDLNASNIMAASTTNQRQWCADITSVINRKGHYVLVNSVQLVGVCLFVFINVKHVPFMRDVATAMVKTGLGGATGNKGGVAIRFQLYNSSICFCCSHFAAGQSNVGERNSDFQEISRKLVFPADLTPHGHDFVFWCGDFNYRIDMGNDFVRDFIAKQDWPSLVEGDQLTFSKRDGKTFEDYVEAPVLFPPTYKYDLFTDNYDTSEKCRCPAWTDRVLVRGRKFGDVELNEFSIVYYGRSEIQSSDHRPVNALVETDIHITDEKHCEAVLEDILSKMGPSDGAVIISADDLDALYEPEMYTSVIGAMSHFGDILFTRYSGSHLCVTFSTGQSALSAAQYDGTEINGRVIRIELRLTNWREVLDKVIGLCKNTAVALSDTGAPLLLDENEMAMHIPLSDPGAAGLNDLDILHGEETKPTVGKEFAGSLANMALSEAADVDAAAAHDWGLVETSSIPLAAAQGQKVPPPRPPAARPPPVRPAPPKVRDSSPAVDPWAVPDTHAHLSDVLPTEVVPTQRDVLVNAEPPPVHGFDPWDSPVSTLPVTEQKMPDVIQPTAASEVAPPPPPPRRRVGQQLPDVLRNISK